MNNDEQYVPTEEQVRAWCREGTGDYPDVMDGWLDRFLARVRRDAAREVGQYIKRLHPNGLTAKKSVLADIDIAADRMGRGIHANGRDRETP